MLDNVISNLQVKKVLQNALAENRVAHAYLFHGPDGVGKTTLARAFAGALLCGNGLNDACGKCSVCRRVAANQFPDFIPVSPLGNNIKIEQVRELQRKAQFKPYEAQRKVYLIDRAESMTVEAANCLLKILEDPPPDTVFLLTAANPYNLLPTVISRCQLIPLTNVPLGQIKEMLVKRYQVEPHTAELLASLSGGLPGIAVQMVESGSGMKIREAAFQVADQLMKADLNELFRTAEEFEKKKEILPDILEQLLVWYRDRLIWLQTGEDKLIVNLDKLSWVQNVSGSDDKEYLIRSINYILEAKSQIDKNINLRLVLEVLLLRLARAA